MQPNMTWTFWKLWFGFMAPVSLLSSLGALKLKFGQSSESLAKIDSTHGDYDSLNPLPTKRTLTQTHASFDQSFYFNNIWRCRQETLTAIKSAIFCWKHCLTLWLDTEVRYFCLDCSTFCVFGDQHEILPESSVQKQTTVFKNIWFLVLCT